MNNLISKLFFIGSALAYLAFASSRAEAFGVHDYSTDVIIMPLLGLLAHIAFERKASS